MNVKYLATLSPKSAIEKFLALNPRPKSLPDQVRILRDVLSSQTGPTTAESIARQFIKAPTDRVEELLETLVAMGQARAVGDAQFIV